MDSFIGSNMSDYNAEKDISTYNKKLNECLSNRLNAYQTELGNWQEQLDMIYHDIDAWKSKVLAIKNKYPKPEE
tara:strand:+ start:2522 stop:2743 length:222 start_codon:yes stop_codon:yes gene_type:complete